jgi:hypothetical protein
MKTVTAETKREIIQAVSAGKITPADAAFRYAVPEPLIQSWIGAPGATAPKVILKPPVPTTPKKPPQRAVIPKTPRIAPPPAPTPTGRSVPYGSTSDSALNRAHLWFRSSISTRQGQVAAAATALLLLIVIAAILRPDPPTVAEETNPPTPTPPTPTPTTPTPTTPPPTTPTPTTPTTTTPTPTTPTPTTPPTTPTTTPPAEGDSVGTRVYKRALKSTVLIGCRTGMGSGFLIDLGRKLIVTAYHVVEDETDVVVMFPEFKADGTVIADQDYYFTTPLRPNSVQGKVMVSLKSKDLALIQITNIPAGFVPFELSTKRSVPGEDVYTVGNPGASKGMWIFSGGHVRQVFDNFNIGYPTNNQRIHAAIAQTTNPTNPGDSGGPVINRRGQIIGMTSGGVVDVKVDLVSFAIDVTEIHAMWERFLRK